MRLPELHRKLLENYNHFHDRPPSIRELMSMSVINHIALLMIFGAFVSISLAFDETYFATGLVGVILGAFGRDLGWYRRTVQLWPLQNVILDWNKIDEILTVDCEQ